MPVLNMTKQCKYPPGTNINIKGFYKAYTTAIITKKNN